LSRSDNDRLGDIVRASRRIAAIAACGRDAFDRDWTLRDAAAHQIEIVVDAYTKLDEDTRQRFGDLSVRDMANMRIILAHVYWRTDYDLVWGVITDDIPGILETAEREHEPPASGPSVFDEDLAIPRWQPPDTSVAPKQRRPQ